MALYRHTDGKLLYIDNKLAHNANCCCGDGLYVGCYCPSSVPACISGLTTAELAALNYFPYTFTNSLDENCESAAGTSANTYRCLGYPNPNPISEDIFCADTGPCPSEGTIIFTGPEGSSQGSLNCNQYINFAQNGMGTCKGYDISTNDYLGKFCSVDEASCDALAIDYGVTTVWTLGTCHEIYSVSIETIPDPDAKTFETLCSERNCCDSDDCSDPIFCGCSTWLIVEVGANGTGGNQYQSGNTLTTIPATWKPTVGPSNGGWTYTGYMQLKITCRGITRIAESWTTINGSTHTLGTYGANCVDGTSFTADPVEYTTYNSNKTSSNSGSPF